MTMPPPSVERQQIVIPAQGMVDIRDALTDILSEFGTSDKIGLLHFKYVFVDCFKGLYRIINLFICRLLIRKC